jgi:hypothetical protein
MVGSEDVALPESLSQKMLQRLKRWSSLKHYMWSLGMKDKTLQGKGKGALKPIALRWQWPFNGKLPWIANAHR